MGVDVIYISIGVVTLLLNILFVILMVKTKNKLKMGFAGTKSNRSNMFNWKESTAQKTEGLDKTPSNSQTSANSKVGTSLDEE